MTEDASSWPDDDEVRRRIRHCWNISDLSPQVTEYANFGLRHIEGWGINPFLSRLFLTLDRFQEINGVVGNLFEIGVHHGRSAILLAMMARAGETSVFLDLFERQAENVDSSGRGSREILTENLQTWVPGKPVTVIEANSMGLDFALVGALAEGVRFAHIDGGHHYEVVMNDLIKTEQILKPGGIVVVDDFLNSRFPEVCEACNDYLNQDRVGRLTPVALGHNKLILTPRESRVRLQAYLAFMGAQNRPPLLHQIRFHGVQVLCLDRH